MNLASRLRGLKSTPQLFTLLFFGVFLLTFLWHLPVSIIGFSMNQAAGQFSYMKIEGTLWRGVIRQASVQGVSLGDIQYRINPFRLAVGAIDSNLSLRGGALDGNIMIVAGLGGITIRNTELAAKLSSIKKFKLMGEPFSGSAKVRVDRARWSNKGCRYADGDIWTDVLKGPAQLYGQSGYELAGPISCESNSIVISLKGSGEEGDLGADIRIDPDLRYNMMIKVTGAPSEMRDALMSFGFEESDGALVHGSMGVLQGVGS